MTNDRMRTRRSSWMGCIGLAVAREHRSGHAYSLEEFGLEADVIRSELSDLFDRYAWDADAAPASAREGGA